MRQWIIISACLVCLASGAPVLAADFTQEVVAELQQQGYGRIATETTWLGRVRIVAERGKGSREIILNPRTGEILRDLWLLADGSSGRSAIIGDDGGDDGSDDGGSNSGSDDNDDDSSGSGSGSSGSGSSGSDDSGSDDSGSDDSGSDDSGSDDS